MIKLFYKRPLFYLSFVVIFIGLSGIYSNLLEKKAYANALNVNTIVIEEPYNCESINHKTSYVKLKYNNKIYVKKIGASYCDQIGKKYILAKYDVNSDSLFFMEDNFDEQIIYSALILLVGIIIAFKGWKK